MRTLFRLKWFPLAFVLVTCCACRSVAGVNIDVELKNETSGDVREAEVHFGKHFVFGEHCFVGKGFSKTYIDYPYVEPGKVEVAWTVSGKAQTRPIDISKLIPKGRSGTLTFTIHDDNVKASFKPKKKVTPDKG